MTGGSSPPCGLQLLESDCDRQITASPCKAHVTSGAARAAASVTRHLRFEPHPELRVERPRGLAASRDRQRAPCHAACKRRLSPAAAARGAHRPLAPDSQAAPACRRQFAYVAVTTGVAREARRETCDMRCCVNAHAGKYLEKVGGVHPKAVGVAVGTPDPAREMAAVTAMLPPPLTTASCCS